MRTEGSDVSSEKCRVLYANIKDACPRRHSPIRKCSQYSVVMLWEDHSSSWVRGGCHVSASSTIAADTIALIGERSTNPNT